MKRLTAVALGLLVLAACQDSTTPMPDGQDIGRPNISITDPNASYGFVDGYFSFLKPLVDNPTVSGNALNTHLMPTIELWRQDQVLGVTSGDYACVPAQSGAAAIATFVPAVNSDTSYYQYNWKTSDQTLTTGDVYRLCVKVQLANGKELVGWRDVQPDTTNSPNNPAGRPYLFKNGSNIPIKFWLSSKSLCYDAGGNVIDCTVATFDANGGTAYCDNPQCGMDFPQGLLTNGQLVTFELRYIKCPSYNIVNGDTVAVEYLDIDIPQFYGCMTVKSYANFPGWQGFQGGNTSGIVIAACRDTDVPSIDDDRFLIHIESDQVDVDGHRVVYSLPTRPFMLDCDQTNVVQAPGADASLGDWTRYYAAVGARALKRTFLPFVDPPALAASHAGFGGGSGSTCASVSSADGANPAVTCTTPSLATGASTAGLEMSAVYEYRAVWALPSMIKERLKVDASGNIVGDWVDPVSTAGGTLYPAVRVVNAVECESTYGGTDCTSTEENVAWATVRFRDDQGNVAVKQTNAQGIAFAPWAVPATAGLYADTAGGLGIGVDPSLASVTVAPPPAEGTYQDHLGNYAVPLKAPKVKFEASVCSDYRSVLTTPGVDDVYTEKGGNVQEIPINISGAGSMAYLYTLTDCYNTYFALKVPAAQDLQNSLRIVFVDEETHGTLPDTQFTAVPIAGTLPARSDDMWMIRRATKKDAPVALGTWLLEDWHVSNDCTGSSKQSECGAYDVAVNGEPGQNLIPGSDGLAVHEVSGATVFEFARRFGAPVDPQDFPTPGVGESVKVGFYLVLQMGNGAQGNTEWPDFRVFQPITITRQ